MSLYTGRILYCVSYGYSKQSAWGTLGWDAPMVVCGCRVSKATNEFGMTVRAVSRCFVTSMLYREVTASWFTASGECPEAQKLLENPLLPQNKTSNFEKAFDAQSKFKARVDCCRIRRGKPFNRKTFCRCRENTPLVKRYATRYVARLHSPHWFNGNTMKPPAFGFFVVDYES